MPAASPQVPRTRSGNRRDETARLAVLHAADDLLVEHGFGALTVEAIARRAGVAKQTIYRWWPSKVEILLDTLIADSEKHLPVPGEPVPGECGPVESTAVESTAVAVESSAESVRGYFRGFARFLSGDPAGQVLLALLAEAQHDPGTAANLRERYLVPRRERERALLSRAVDAGGISPVLDLDAAIDALVGPIVYRVLTGADVPPGLVDTLFDALLRPRSG